MSKRPRKIFLKESPPASGSKEGGASSDQNDDDDNAYVWSEEAWWTPRRRRRPYPASSQMILKLKSSVSASEKKTTAKQGDLPPVFTSFLASIGRLPDSGAGNNNSDNKEGEEEKDADENSAGKIVAALDDPSRSTLTTGQHQRYIALLSSGQVLKPHQKKEFRKLKHLIQEEQNHYRQALLDFWLANKDRVLVGFTNTHQQSSSSSQAATAAKFVELAACPHHVRLPWQREFKGMVYGKCCQVMSLETAAGISAGNKGRWTVDVIESQALETTAEKSQHQDEGLTALPDVGSRVPLPAVPKHPVRFFKHDKKAIQLAREHHIPMLATLEAIEAIMATENAHWSLPVHFRDGLAIVDLPLPQPDSSPRACLTRGLNEGLSQWVANQFNEEKISKEKIISEEEQRYRYVLLVLPQSSGVVGSAVSRQPKKVKQTKVLVRVPNQSTRIHAHVEYFPERGEETTSSYERSLWILDHFLKFERSLVARIDPSSCRVTKWEPTSKAHALAGIGEGSSLASTTGMPSSSQDPLDHFHLLAKVLQGIPTITRNDGNFLLCLPGRDKHPLPRSASVHMMETIGVESAPTSSEIINVEAELDRAGEVQLGANAIQRTMHDWKWISERAPFTFPIDSTKSDFQEGNKHGKRPS